MKRQFIAGAACPKCGQTDTIMRISNNDEITYRCIQCDFHKTQGESFEHNEPDEHIVNIIKKRPKQNN